MPDTLHDVSVCLDLCRTNHIRDVTLLVVPGHDWQVNQLEQLRTWTSQGCILGGHGWSHSLDQSRTLHWRAVLHAQFVSRHCGEHLALTRDESLELIETCHAWFKQHDFPVPTLYVPPAWALGALRPTDLFGLPFEKVEVLQGWIDTRTARVQQVPLWGYEADTAFRAVFLRAFNKLNSLFAARLGLRIAIHPQDYRLLLQHKLQRDLAALGGDNARMLRP